MDFTITGKERGTLFGFMALGLVCLIATFFWGDPADISGHHTRFWANFLHNSVFFTGIAFTALFVMAAFITAYAGWFTIVKRIWEAFSMFIGVGLILMLIFGVATYLNMHDLYHWNVPGVTDINNPAYDEIISNKSAFLNGNVFLFGSIAVLALWFFFAFKLRSISKSEDIDGSKGDFSFHYNIRWWSALFLPIGGFTSAFVIWQWVMSIDSHWYSTMFAWYATASWFVSCLAITILLVIYLKSRGFLEGITGEHLHDLGKYLFAFSIFWTYLWFSQYMLIWYANVGEETIYFRTRVDQYPALFYANLLINFVLPFFVLMRNSTKRKYGTLVFVCVFVLFGHWLDFFQMIRPGVLHTAHEIHAGHGSHADAGHDTKHISGHNHDGHSGAHHDATHAGHDHGDSHSGYGDHADDHGDHGHGHSTFTAGFTLPGFLDIGTFLGFFAFFLWFIMSRMTTAKLIPENDPYLEESLNHHT